MQQRLLIASTPRTGNTWLRKQLGELLGLAELAVHTPDELDWTALPARTLVQLHWLPEPQFCERLRQHGFRTLVIARHPLDVLISILHFAPHEPNTARWLDGAGGDESAIIGQSPVSPATLQYGCSPRFRALLDISTAWWQRAGVVRIRYEDAVADTRAALQRACDALGSPSPTLENVVERNAFDRLRTTSTNQHFWRGQPGLWRRLLPADIASAVYRANEPCFRALGYSLDADTGIDRHGALANWRAVA